ncbi:MULTISPECIES: glyoxalase III HchA [Luteococcus]|uniref:Chaperone protein hchA n=1 Tax=Luteococcus japonicus LSP_Lj1 TaxID=1255658 RepID=A0A1R4JHJ0_9ACTN|nr:MULTISPECIES: glyoxalase III HchA [Luteococcus]MDN5564571.1 protein deglycase HchA [Luteococcus sp.]SJN31404.1 Chaperone protein hchA [Luteococcus japonicus LSP_Lj1]
MFDSKKPQPDTAEHDAWFPSEFSLAQYVPPMTDYEAAEPGTVTSGPRKILMIATDERYLPVEGGQLFSTGNHPVETLLPVMHLVQAGYEVEVATPSGLMAKLELWAFPAKDQAVKDAYEALLPKLKAPKKLADVIAHELGAGSDYAAVFIPGGHGAMIGLPSDEQVGTVLRWALDNDRHIITLCHGPAALLAAGDAFAGYKIAVFPDSLDEGANVKIGYLPGKLTWALGERLKQRGVELVNDGMTGAVHADRLLLTGDSPLAANALGQLAVEKLRERV